MTSIVIRNEEDTAGRRCGLVRECYIKPLI